VISNYFIGVDLGQRRDHTALAVLERAEVEGEWDAVWYRRRREERRSLRHLERVALGTPYPEIVERVRGLAQSPWLAGRSTVVVDATGVGAPVVDMLRRARLGAALVPVLITGGETESQGDGYYRVPKRDLITGLQVMLDGQELLVAKGLRDGSALLREMAEMEVRVGAQGRESYGAWREGMHDDLVLAVAVACWGLRKRYGPKVGEVGRPLW
jgi:hypothetical protein